MGKPTKTAAVLCGLGVGVAAGPVLGSGAVWVGLAVVALGLGLLLLGRTESDLVGDGLAGSDDATRASSDGTSTDTVARKDRRQRRQQPTLEGLGTRVEHILTLAEGQADDHRAEARREADEIIRAAREEAEAIRRPAGGSTGQDPI